MNIVLNHKPVDSRTQSRFNKLWQKVQKQQQLNRKFETDIEKLMAVYQQQCLPLERAVVPEYCRLAERLLELFARKSLAQWHREAMLDWITGLIDKVGSLEPAAADRLLERYKEAVAHCAGLTVPELEDEWQAMQEQEQADWEELAAEEAAIDKLMDDLFGALGGQAASSQDDLFGFNEDEQRAEPEPAPAEPVADVSAADEASLTRWLQQLFRRTAQALHPDREPDATLRTRKQQLMSELLEARERDDVMTMLTFYIEHVGGGGLELAEREMTAVSRMLEAQLCNLEQAREDWLYAHPLRLVAFENLYEPTEKARGLRLQAYTEALRQQAGEMSELVGYLRNLNCLKEVLREREEMRQALRFEQLMDDFEIRC